MTRRNIFKTAWHDPVWSKVIAAGLIFVLGSTLLYLRDRVDFLSRSTEISNIIVILAAAIIAASIIWFCFRLTKAVDWPKVRATWMGLLRSLGLATENSTYRYHITARMRFVFTLPQKPDNPLLATIKRVFDAWITEHKYLSITFSKKDQVMIECEFGSTEPEPSTSVMLQSLKVLETELLAAGVPLTDFRVGDPATSLDWAIAHYAKLQRQTSG